MRHSTGRSSRVKATRSILSSGVPDGNAELPGRLGIRSRRRKAFIGARHQHAVGLLEEVVEGVGNVGRSARPGKAASGKEADLGDERLAVARADAVDANDIGILGQFERLALRLVGFAEGAS